MAHHEDGEKGRCRHEKYGHCSNHLWNVMKTSGKPGLKEYLCVYWLAKTQALETYLSASWRAQRFGLDREQRAKSISKALNRIASPTPRCPDFMPQSAQAMHTCRFCYLETCLLLFPECDRDCPDYLPVGDQTG